VKGYDEEHGAAFADVVDVVVAVVGIAVVTAADAAA